MSNGGSKDFPDDGTNGNCKTLMVTKKKVSPNVDDARHEEKHQREAVIANTIVPASEALLGITRIDANQVRVELAKGWEFALPKTYEEDPGCLIIWDDDNTSATVDAMNDAMAAGGGPNPPDWLNLAALGGPITVPHLKASILIHAQTTGGGGGVIGNALIAPNTMMQYSSVCIGFSMVGFDPFFMAHAVCPIGRHYVLLDNRRRTTAVADPILTPPVGLGVGVFT